jgi:hypothetical protein
VNGYFFWLLVIIVKSRRYIRLGPDIAVEWPRVWLRIREIPASILGPKAAYTQRSSVGFLSYTLKTGKEICKWLHPLYSLPFTVYSFIVISLSDAI